MCAGTGGKKKWPRTKKQQAKMAHSPKADGEDQPLRPEGEGASGAGSIGAQGAGEGGDPNTGGGPLGHRQPLPVARDQAFNYYFNFLFEKHHILEGCVLELLTTSLSMADVCFIKSSDRDALQVKAGECTEQVFLLLHDHENWLINSKMRADHTEQEDIPNYGSIFVTAARNIADNYSCYQKKHGNVNETLVQLIGDLEQYLMCLMKISRCEDLHDLLIMSIEGDMHKKMLEDRDKHIKVNPLMSIDYTRFNIYPYQYYWSPYSSCFIAWMGQCSPITIGASYSLNEIVTMVQKVIQHKLEKHSIRETTINNELSHFFHLGKHQFNIHDKRTLIYPLLKMLYPESFYTTWSRKFIYMPRISLEQFHRIYDKQYTLPLMGCAFEICKTQSTNDLQTEYIYYANGPGM